ncbi:MAG: TetR/AcrR family transcriptional regulator [Actinomycetota bacterium]
MAVSDATDTPVESNGSVSADDAELDPRVERTRRAVLDAGIQLLFERGPDGVTPAAVANTARISRTTLYKYWPTRAELLYDVLEEVEPRPEIELRGDVRVDLLAMLTTYCTGMNDPEARKVFSSVLARAQWDADTREVQLKMEEYALDHLTRVFSAAASNGQLPDGLDVRAEAAHLMGPMVFRVLVTRDEIRPTDVERIVDDWLATVRR